MNRLKNNRGVIAIEACITVVMFMILMLFLSGLFKMFMAQNLTAHAVIQAAQSLSIDAYAADKFSSDGQVKNIGDLLNNLLDTAVNDDKYYNFDNWFFESGYNDQGRASAEESQHRAYSPDEAVKNRFITYLAGGSETRADSILKGLNVVGGLSGLDFSQTKVEGGVLYVVVQYQLRYEFEIGTLIKPIEVRQKVQAKLWT